MSHNYRQAIKSGYVQNVGYHITLQTILEKRGLLREKRANVEAVRAALKLKEMKEQHILPEMQPFKEELITVRRASAAEGG